MKTVEMTYAQIDLDILVSNYRSLRKKIGSSVRFAAVIKADAYGHGAVETARIALQEGASYLVVARLCEALHLRENGIDAPILLLGAVLSEEVPKAAAAAVTLSVNGEEDALRISRSLNGHTVKVHIKADTGMGRLGMSVHSSGYDEAGVLQNVRAIFAMPGIEVEGLYTHFASADAADDRLDFCRSQFGRFRKLIELLERHAMRPSICHCANSAAALRFPEMRLDMCRLGIVQYGLWPSQEFDHSLADIRPVMSFRSHIIFLKNIPEGFPVSYGSVWTSARPSRVATVAIGYADGYHRILSGRALVLLHGKRVPVIGRVCMDLLMLDVTDVPEAAVGDSVTAWGYDCGELLSADEVAAWAGTIGYEMTSGLTARVPRIYTGRLR